MVYDGQTSFKVWFERLRGEGQRCCWCSLDREDNQPQRFLRHVVSALRTVSDIGADVIRQLDTTLIADIVDTLPALVDVREAILRLVADFDGVHGTVRRGFELREVAGGWRIYVRPEYDPVVADFVLTENPSRLSQAALETLAVIAYKQPISRGAVASIRAVNVDSVVRTLLGRGLITEAFTDSETGAINYATTDLLLTQLGINSLDELPLISPLLADGANGFEDLP
jgi:segregation and condensation protein B